MLTKNFFSSFINSIFYLIGQLLNSPGKKLILNIEINNFLLGNKILKFDKNLVIIWILVCLIISNSFKGLLRQKIINQLKWWFHSIKEVINAPSDYPIYASNGITYLTIKEKSKYDPDFKELMKRLKSIQLQNIFSYSFCHNYYNRKCAVFATSFNIELQKPISGNEVVIDEIRYDHMLDVRFIRKDFPFANQMVQL